MKTKTEVWPISRLKEWKRNPREIDAKGLKRLKAHIERFGLYKPLIVNTNPKAEPRGAIAGGNMRLRALNELGYANDETFKRWLSEVFVEEFDVWFQHRDAISKYLHPTQKPVALAERAIKKNTKRGNIVLDVFAGSGSTLIAAEKLDRCAYLMELDPRYVDVIIKRWEQFTGKRAKKMREPK